MKAMIKLGDILSLIGPQQHIRVCEDKAGKEIELYAGKTVALRMSNEDNHKKLLDRYAKLMLIAANLNNPDENQNNNQDVATSTNENVRKFPPFSLKVYIF